MAFELLIAGGEPIPEDVVPEITSVEISEGSSISAP